MARSVAAALRRLRLPASLGAKLVLILTGVGLVGAAAMTVLLALVIMPGFSRLEQDGVDAHVARTRAVLHDYASKVESGVRDYGDWNASYDYMARPNRAFEQESFSTLAMANLEVEGMAYVANDGRVVIARWLDPRSGADAPATRAEFLRRIAAIDLRAALGKANSGSFFLPIGRTLAAVGVAQVRRSDGSGTPRGYILMARTIGSERLSTLLQLRARLDLGSGTQEVQVARRPSSIGIAVPIAGPDGRTVAMAAYAVPRDMSLLGKRMLGLAVLASSLLLAVVLFVLRRMIARLVLKPLHRVERHMGVVRASGTLAPLAERARGDEIGSLVTSFNSMLLQLKDLREQVEVQSFKLGRSESAIAVMHNVRNALNPISTILSQGLGTGPVVDRATLDRAVAELAREDVPAVRRQKLAAFVAAAHQATADERAERARQLEIGREALHHVLEIIGKQQEAAHERPQLESCDVSDIIARNATIARYSGESSIAFTFPSRPHWVMANRVILSQVIGNLFANAAEAIAATGRGTGSIVVQVHQRDDRCEIVIRDDGEGFDPASAPTLFQRGFSTRAHKSGGLGLHWCANSMLAMDGALELVSDGKGLGARAVLKLTVAPGLGEVEGLAA